MKYTAIFRWGLGFYAWGGFLLEELSLGRKISGGGDSQGKFLYWEDLTEFLYEILLIVLQYLCQLSFACGDVPRGKSGGYFPFGLIFRKKNQRKGVFPE
jgi:hypothetical protein